MIDMTEGEAEYLKYRFKQYLGSVSRAIQNKRLKEQKIGMTIAIDKLYMNKIPKSCKECPLTYLDMGDDAYFGASERRCVIDGSCVDLMVSERQYDCPLVEAIPKNQYEARLKADMVAMLTDIQLEIREYHEIGCDEDCNNCRMVGCVEPVNVIKDLDIIQQKIDALRGT